MESLCFVVLGYLLIGEVTHQQYVLQHVQPFFFAEECFRYIFDAAHALMEEQRTIDILSVRDALITDIDNAALAARIKAFKEYFVCCGDLPKHCSDEDVKTQITLLLTQITNGLTYSVPPKSQLRASLLTSLHGQKKSCWNPIGTKSRTHRRLISPKNCSINSKNWNATFGRLRGNYTCMIFPSWKMSLMM